MTWAELISAAFAPELFVLGATLLVVGCEPSDDDWRSSTFALRVSAVLVAFALAFAVYRGGPSAVSGSVPGGDDFFASAGLIVGFAVIWLLWTRREWGIAVPTYSLLLIVTSVLHVVIVPTWDVSSHVLYAAVPTGYLLTVDRRFVVLLAVPLVLVWSRVTLEAHTLGESLGALVVAAVIGATTLIASRVSVNDN